MRNDLATCIAVVLTAGIAVVYLIF